MLVFVYADWNYADYSMIGFVLSLFIIIRAAYLTFKEDLITIAIKVFASLVFMLLSFMVIGGFAGIGLGFYLALTSG